MFFKILFDYLPNWFWYPGENCWLYPGGGGPLYGGGCRWSGGWFGTAVGWSDFGATSAMFLSIVNQIKCYKMEHSHSCINYKVMFVQSKLI